MGFNTNHISDSGVVTKVCFALSRASSKGRSLSKDSAKEECQWLYNSTCLEINVTSRCIQDKGLLETPLQKDSQSKVFLPNALKGRGWIYQRTLKWPVWLQHLNFEGGEDLEAKIAKAKKTWAVAGLQGEDTMAEKHCKWSLFTHLTTLWRGGAPLQQ